MSSHFMKEYFITDKFTLVPTALCKPEYLTGLFALDRDESVQSIGLPQFNATLLYAANNIETGKSPLIYKLIDQIESIQEHNKVIIHYSKELKILQVVAAEERKLLLANSFKCHHPNTILYYLTLVCQQVMFNPHLTKISVYGDIESQEEALIKKYFQGIIFK